MSLLKVKILEKVGTKSLTQFLGLTGVATMLPFFIHLQWLTGPIINAILIITLLILGFRTAVLVALIPSAVALYSGLLPFVLAPMIPFIMISNIIFIGIIFLIYEKSRSELKGYWAAIFVASAVKFSFLYFSVGLISNFLIKQELALKVAQILSWPQFYSALAGGVIAFFILRWLRRF